MLRPQMLAGIVALLCVGGGLLLGRPAAPRIEAVRMVLPAAGPHVAGAAVPQTVPQPRVNCSVRACLALTFDDGPNAAITPQLLDILERHHTHATFFVIGVHVSGHEALLRRMQNDGDEIGNHSWSHPDLTALDGPQIEHQVALTQRAVTAAGVPAPTLFRPPYGAVNGVVRMHVPLTMAMWNIDPEDWKAKNSKEVIDRVQQGARPGRVVDLHDTSQATVDALDPLLTNLEQQYQLVTFSELFNLAPGQPGEYFGR